MGCGWLQVELEERPPKFRKRGARGRQGLAYFHLYIPRQKSSHAVSKLSKEQRSECLETALLTKREEICPEGRK